MKLRNLKKRIAAGVLAAFMAFGGGSTATAATGTTIGWKFEEKIVQQASAATYKQDTNMTVEVGQKFYFSHLFGKFVRSAHKVYYGTQLKLSYASSAPKVLAVGKTTGYAIAKTTGTAKVMVTYARKKYTCSVKVVRKGALGTGKTIYRKMNEAAAVLARYENKKVTSANVYALVKQAAKYRTNAKKLTYPVTSVNDYGYLGDSTKLVVPYACQAEAVIGKISVYLRKNDPTKAMKIQKVSGTAGKNELKLTLSKAVTEKDLYLLSSFLSSFYDVPKNKVTTYVVNVRLADCTDEYMELHDHSFRSESYYAKAVLTKGSRTVTVKLEDFYGEPVRLEKGGIYEISFTEDQKPVRFTVK